MYYFRQLNIVLKGCVVRAAAGLTTIVFDHRRWHCVVCTSTCSASTWCLIGIAKKMISILPSQLIHHPLLLIWPLILLKPNKQFLHPINLYQLTATRLLCINDNLRLQPPTHKSHILVNQSTLYQLLQLVWTVTEFKHLAQFFLAVQQAEG